MAARLKRNRPMGGTRGTRPLQLWRSRGPSVLGPLQLPQLAVFFAGHCGKLTVLSQTSLLKLRGKERKVWEGMGET